MVSSRGCIFEAEGGMVLTGRKWFPTRGRGDLQPGERGFFQPGGGWFLFGPSPRPTASKPRPVSRDPPQTFKHPSQRKPRLLAMPYMVMKQSLSRVNYLQGCSMSAHEGGLDFHVWNDGHAAQTLAALSQMRRHRSQQLVCFGDPSSMYDEQWRQ